MRLHAEQDYWLQTHLFRIFNKVFILPFQRSEGIHHPFSPLSLLTRTQKCSRRGAGRVPPTLSHTWSGKRAPNLAAGTARVLTSRLPKVISIYFIGDDVIRGYKFLKRSTARATAQLPVSPSLLSSLCFMPRINAETCIKGIALSKVTQQLPGFSGAGAGFNHSFTPGCELSGCC